MFDFHNITVLKLAIFPLFRQKYTSFVIFWKTYSKLVLELCPLDDKIKVSFNLGVRKHWNNFDRYYFEGNVKFQGFFPYKTGWTKAQKFRILMIIMQI